MKRYRVVIRNAKECCISLNFPDLCIHYSNGFSPSLKVMEGEEIPLDVCDPEDIRKSLLAGSLKGYLANGWLEEILEETSFLSSNSVIQNSSQFVTEQDIKIVPQTEISTPQTNLPEVQVVEKKSISVTQDEPITDLTKISSYEDFNRLSHFLKLRFIKESSNIDLLKEIAGKTSSAQFKNNINLRLSIIK